MSNNIEGKGRKQRTGRGNRSASVRAGRKRCTRPGAVATELLNTISEPDVAEAVRKRTAQIAIPAESFARGRRLRHQPAGGCGRE